jgi:hypothetical protein
VRWAAAAAVGSLALFAAVSVGQVRDLSSSASLSRAAALGDNAAAIAAEDDSSAASSAAAGGNHEIPESRYR